MRQLGTVAACLLVLGGVAHAAVAPQLVNYQGVLRDADGVPQEGSFAMTFRFYDAEGPCPSGGTLLLTDVHPSVPVASGVFNVELGGGTLVPGSARSLAAVFVSIPRVFLQVEVEGEPLCPRTRVLSSPYAINAARESDGPLELFVDGRNGNDENDGLSPATAKATVSEALRAIPAVLNGDVNVRIEPGVYSEELVLSRRIRNGPHTIRLIQRTDDPFLDPPQVVLRPPPIPAPGSLSSGVASFDELVELIGLRIDDFDTGSGVAASGGTSLQLINCIVVNCNGPGAAVRAADGHFLLLVNTTLSDNNLAIESADHGSVDVRGDLTLTGNATAAVARQNSHIDFETGTCNFSGNGPMQATGFSTIDGYAGCGANAACDPPAGGPNGSCSP